VTWKKPYEKRSRNTFFVIYLLSDKIEAMAVSGLAANSSDKTRGTLFAGIPNMRAQEPAPAIPQPVDLMSSTIPE
jgi:hypothetical protein